MSVGPWHVNHDAIVDVPGRGAVGAAVPVPDAGVRVVRADVGTGGGGFRTRPRTTRRSSSSAFHRRPLHGSGAPARRIEDAGQGFGEEANVGLRVWNRRSLPRRVGARGVGTSDQYMELLRRRPRASGPTYARVTNGGYAGIKVGTVDARSRLPLRRRKLPARLRRRRAERSLLQRPASAGDGDRHERGARRGRRRRESADLRGRPAVARRRDRHSPACRSWLTETGYDTGGPRAGCRGLVAARLPRVAMMGAGGRRGKSSSTARPIRLEPPRRLRPAQQRQVVQAIVVHLRHAPSRVRRRHDRPPRAPPRPKRARVPLDEGTDVVLSAWAVDGTAPLGLDLGRCTLTDSFGAERRGTDEGDAADDLPRLRHRYCRLEQR